MQLDIRSSQFKINPYPLFKQYRQHQPVGPTSIPNIWGVFRYKDVKRILKDDDIFSSILDDDSSSCDDLNVLLHNRSLVGMDNPQHNYLRSLLSKAFLPSSLLALDDVIDDACQMLLNQIPINQPFDFAQQFSKNLPILVLSSLLGISNPPVQQMKHWIHSLLTWRNQPDDVKAKLIDLYHFLKQQITYKRKYPCNDLLSTLIHNETDGTNLSDNDLIALIRLMLTAGTDTASSLMNHALLLLAKHPDVYAALQYCPELANSIITETIRYNSPVIALLRRTTRPVTLSGVTIDKQQTILAFVASANHDERIYSHPERFILDRPDSLHLGFGSGIHHCLGIHLGMRQVSKALQHIALAFSKVTVQDKQPKYISTLIFRSFEELPVIFSGHLGG